MIHFHPKQLNLTVNIGKKSIEEAWRWFFKQPEIKTLVEQFVVNNADIEIMLQNKREYLIKNPTLETIPYVHNVKKWAQFLPPVLNVRVIKHLQPLGSDFKNDFIELEPHTELNYEDLYVLLTFNNNKDKIPNLSNNMPTNYIELIKYFKNNLSDKNFIVPSKEIFKFGLCKDFSEIPKKLSAPKFTMETFGS